MYLPDINFWLALAFQSHAHHGAAKAWMLSAPEQSCCFCRLTQLGFLRLSTNRKIFPLDALTMHEAWDIYDELLSDIHVVFAEESEELEIAWRSLTPGNLYSTNVWADAYLAAFACTADLEVVTFDRGFIQYRDLKCTLLKST